MRQLIGAAGAVAIFRHISINAIAVPATATAATGGPVDVKAFRTTRPITSGGLIGQNSDSIRGVDNATAAIGRGHVQTIITGAGGGIAMYSRNRGIKTIITALLPQRH